MLYYAVLRLNTLPNKIMTNGKRPHNPLYSHGNLSNRVGTRASQLAQNRFVTRFLFRQWLQRARAREVAPMYPGGPVRDRRAVRRGKQKFKGSVKNYKPKKRKR